MDTSWQRFLWLSLAGMAFGILVFWFLSYSIPAEELAPGTWPMGLGLAALAGLTTLWLWRSAHQGLAPRLPYQTRFSLRLALGLLSFLLAGWGIAVVIFEGYALATLQPLLPMDGADLSLKLLIILLFSGLIFSIADFTLFSYNQFAVVQIRAAQQERERMELQYELLRSQLTPHFLFNSLNTVSSLLYRSGEEAEEFVRRLAAAYQYLLTIHRKNLVSVAEELDFLKAFHYLLSVRFGEGLRLQVQLPDSVQRSLIPPLTFQLLLENAVKHNTLSQHQPLVVRISTDGKDILVSNNRTTPPASAYGSLKMGLSNISKRYSFFCQRPVVVKEDEVFAVQLPIIPQPH